MDTMARIETPAQYRARQAAENRAAAAARKEAGLEFPVATCDLSVTALSLIAPMYAGCFRSDIECQAHMAAAEMWSELGGGLLIGWQFQMGEVLLYAELILTASAGRILSIRPA